MNAVKIAKQMFDFCDGWEGETSDNIIIGGRMSLSELRALCEAVVDAKKIVYDIALPLALRHAWQYTANMDDAILKIDNWLEKHVGEK
jgi:hypothetical protein